MTPNSTPHVRTRSRPSQSTPTLDGVLLSRKTETALTPPPVHQSKFECVAVERLTTGDTKVRRHPKAQLNRLIDNLNRFQHAAPILIDGRYRIIDGHLLFEALKRLADALHVTTLVGFGSATYQCKVPCPASKAGSAG
jgi:hypothetical protein